MLLIELAKKSEIPQIQEIFNCKENCHFFGGFSFEKEFINKIDNIRPSLFCAKLDNTIVGAMFIEGRPQMHMYKYGKIAVTPKYQRQRIGSTLYIATTFSGILEGRRYFEDSIVDDNPIQFASLPKLGLKMVAELKHRIMSGKDLCLFSLDLLEENIFETMINRKFPGDLKINLIENSYTRDLWDKNIEYYQEKFPEFAKKIIEYKKFIQSMCSIEIIPDEKRKKTLFNSV